MRTARSRALNVLAAVEAVRAAHPEFAYSPTPRRFWRMLALEQIHVIHVRIRRPARSRGFDGNFVITLRRNLSPREAWKWALHEFAHISLGHFAEGDEVERQLSPCRRGDPREHEANLFALYLTLGLNATPEHPKIAALIAQLEAPRYLARMPAQLPLELPASEPIPRFAAHSRDELEAMAATDVGEHPKQLDARSPAAARALERRIAAAGAKRMRRAPAPRHDDESERIKFYDEAMRASRLTDRDGRRWWIYNYRVVTDPAGARRRERVRDFTSRDIEYRIFMNALGVARVYRFRDRREARDYKTKHLDRQLAAARPLPPAVRPRVVRTTGQLSNASTMSKL